jgi:hypothetical protein
VKVSLKVGYQSRRREATQAGWRRPVGLQSAKERRFHPAAREADRLQSARQKLLLTTRRKETAHVDATNAANPQSAQRSTGQAQRAATTEHLRQVENLSAPALSQVRLATTPEDRHRQATMTVTQKRPLVTRPAPLR